MEPLDLPRSDEKARCSRGRRSSILKAPKRFPDPEPEEKPVECVKPLDRRNSRRVSFAPANNVFLFSKDAKNGSPVRSPLQNITTTPSGQSRVQVEAAENVNQQILGMETLLNAPLHASQQWEKVGCESGEDAGERTLMFADSMFMDLTQSHTINLANDSVLPEDFPRQSKPGGSHKTLLFAAADASSAPGPDSDQDFMDFLASRFKPSAEPPLPREAAVAVERNSSQVKTQRREDDKENQLHSSALLQKSVNKTWSLGETLQGGAAENNVEMMEEEEEDDDPFQCLFPSQEMYSQSGRAAGQKTAGSSGPKAAAGRAGRPGRLTDMEISLKPSLKTKDQHQPVKNVEVLPAGGERTVRFSTDDACLDVTRSHTVNIATHFGAGLQQNPDFVHSGGEKTVKFSADDACLDVTRSHTVNIATHLEAGLQQNFDFAHYGGEKTVRFSTDDACLDVTRSHTVNISTNFDGQSLKNMEVLPSGSERTLRFSADDACLDVTKCHTVNISTNFDGQSLKNVEVLPSGGEKTMRFSTDDACLDVTRSHTVNISTHFEGQSLKNMEVLPSAGEKTVRFSTDDACLDVTRSHTVNISTHFEGQPLKNMEVLPSGSERTVRFSTDDACLDVTRCHTVNISTNFEGQSLKNMEVLPSGSERTVRFSTDDACLDVTRSHTVNISTHFEGQPLKNMEVLPSGSERTVRFSTDDACLDVTRSHTVNIATNIEGQSLKKKEILPYGGEKTLRFSTDDACLDVTRSHTVNIATNIEGQSLKKKEILPSGGEKTMRFSTDDACLDVTRSHTVNISTHFEGQPLKNMKVLPSGSKRTVRLSTNDACMDVTRSHTVNIAAHVDPDCHQNLDLLPRGGQGTMRFSAVDQTSPSEEKTQQLAANDAAMDMTQCLTANISNNLLSDSVHVQQDSQVSPTCGRTSRRSSLYARDPGPEQVSGSWMNPVIPRGGASAENFEEPVETDSFVAPPESHVEDEAPAAVTGGEGELSMDMTEARTGPLLGDTCTLDPPPSPSPPSEHVTSLQSSEAPEMSNRDGVEVSRAPGSPGTTGESQTSTQGVDRDRDSAPSKSRRKSLADLRSKLRRLSHIVSADPEPAAVEPVTAPLPLPDHESLEDAAGPPEPEACLGSAEDDAQTPEEPLAAAATPFKLKTKDLLSRLSVGGFRAKLPQARKTPKKGEDARTADVSVQLGHPDNDVSDINDEELSSCEDISITLDARSPQKTSPPFHIHVDASLQECVSEEEPLATTQGVKRPLQEDHQINVEDEKRMKPSADPQEVVEDMVVQSQQLRDECDGNISAAPSDSTQTASSRCEATFESTFKKSMFESQLEDFTSHEQMKLEDGTITVSEFFKLFNIDFVIHNPRQSVFPELPADSERTSLDLLKDKHLVRPRQLIYEADVQQLREEVEGLKVRTRDLNKPLKMVNRALWEEMRKASEGELKSFGAQLKERNRLFRRMSKAQSHEKKVLLYSNLLQANTEEQQKLRGSIQEADEMIATLDDCIGQLEAELLSVEEKGSDDKRSLTSCHQELMKVTQTLDDNNRQISELEAQTKQNRSRVKQLKNETEKLEEHVDHLNTLIEWRFTEPSRGGEGGYSFLHDTLRLQLLYEDLGGTGAGGESERKISHIAFSHLLNAEGSQDHARLVHQLLAQYMEGEGDWAQRYPTSSHVPTLLHDVSLVVSRCRALGEELRMLRMWGGPRLDIVDISCDGTLIQILFSSLKTRSKFEVVLSAALTNRLYELRVQGFTNFIGDTRIQQIEDIVATFTPAKKLLTKIVKKIHGDLLS